jgi:hypothetical protein
MALRKLQTNFSAGEIQSTAASRSDLPMVQNGVLLLRNAKVLATGGVRRRGGLELCATLAALNYQHHEYLFNTEQTYQLLFSHQRLDIHDGETGLRIQTVTGCPWDGAWIGLLSVFAWGDFIFVAYPDMPTTQIQRIGSTAFGVNPFVFDQETSGSASTHQPFYRFCRPDVPLLCEALSGYDTITGWSPGDTMTMRTPTLDYFTAGHVGTVLQVGDGQVTITAFHDPRYVEGVVRSARLRLLLPENPLTVYEGTNLISVFNPFHAFLAGDAVTVSDATALSEASFAQLNGAMIVSTVTDASWTYSSDPDASGDPPAEWTASGGGPRVAIWAARFQTVDWKEQMYSGVRGWAHCVAGYLGRLILAGGKSTPNRLNLSAIEAPFNFDVGTGQDDEAIQVGLSGTRTPIIRQALGTTHLQIFTSEGEYYVPRLQDNSNITPKNITVLPQTTYGIKPGMRACEFDGATIFISKNANNLRELVFGSNDTGYSAPNLAFPAPHLASSPRSLTVQMEDARYAEATAYICRLDSTLGVFTMVRSEKVAAWGLWQDTTFSNACAVDNRMFFIVRKVIAGVDTTFLTKLNQDRLLDISTLGTYVGRVGQGYQWSGFAAYVGEPITVVVDGRSDIGTFTPDGAGHIVIPVRATFIEGGFGFRTIVRTLPPEMVLPDGPTTGQPRRVVRSSIRLQDALAVTVRNVAGNGRTKLLNTRAESDLGVAAPLMHGDFDIYQLGWDTEGSVEISQATNAPMTLMSIATDVEF